METPAPHPRHHRCRRYRRYRRVRRALVLSALYAGAPAVVPRSVHAQAAHLKIGIIGTVPHSAVLGEARRSGERIGVPLAADDPVALTVAERLVRDAGFEPVVVGGLVRARDFDIGTPVFGRALTARELRQALGLQS